MDDRSLHLDKAALATLAHPLRARLLTSLRLDGPGTATDLAARTGTNTGATSYHLRKLAEVGLVIDTGEGTGRRRVWKAATRYTSYEPSDFAGDPDSRADLAWLERHHLEHFLGVTQSWLDAKPGWPVDWQDAAGLSDDVVTVTPAQLAAMSEELWQVIQRHRDAGVDDPTARRVAVHVFTSVMDADEAPQESDA